MIDLSFVIGVVTRLAGGGSAGHADGIGTVATFNGPSSLAVDTMGVVFVSDTGNRLVRTITPAGR